MLLDIIFKYCIDLRGFFIDPLYLVYNYAKHETPILCIFKFQWPFGTQMELGFSGVTILPEQKYDKKKHTWRPMRLKRALVAQARSQATPPRLVCPSCP
jgi:hypothetical protein